MRIATLTTISLLLLCPASAYAQGGVPLWTNRFTGPASGTPTGIAVDSSGNVFVTGNSWNGSNYDFVTLKYSALGVPLWTNRYDGPANGMDTGSRITVDTNGNVFVTGASEGIGTGQDYATINYSNAGVPLWTNRYNGLGNQNDASSAIAVNSNGDVVVTGGSYNGSSMDFATIMLSHAGGVPLWTNYYDGPAGNSDFATAIAVDGSGNVFVTGTSLNSVGPPDDSEYATIKYSSTGDLMWVNRYDGPGNSEDGPTAIAVDTNGNVFVTGGSYNGPGSNSDYATVAYSRDGGQLWANRYNGPGNDYDSARALAVDSSGNVIVTGYSLASNGPSDYGTIAYSSAGLILWTRRYNGPSNSEDIARALAVDSSGNVFVTGNSYNGPNSDYATIAYSNAGVPLWTNRYPSGAASAIAVDRSGNVFVTGGSAEDFVTIKYSSSVPPPRLDFQKLNNALVLSWTNAGFNLQTAPAVTGPSTNLPAATSPYTNATTGSQQFFRLIGN